MSNTIGIPGKRNGEAAEAHTAGHLERVGIGVAHRW
jgi:hypothetical protein